MSFSVELCTDRMSASRRTLESGVVTYIELQDEKDLVTCKDMIVIIQ